MIGVHFEDNHVATGFGNHLARPILREEWHENLSFEDGVKILEKCMRVLLYRDRSAVNKLLVWLLIHTLHFVLLFQAIDNLRGDRLYGSKLDVTDYVFIILPLLRLDLLSVRSNLKHVGGNLCACREDLGTLV